MMKIASYRIIVAATSFRSALALFLTASALVACARPPVQAPPYPSAPPAAILDRLLADYRALGLPLPPPDAPLVRWEVPSTRIRGPDGRMRSLRNLAFELPRAAGDSEPRLLVGTERMRPSEGSIVRVEPTIEAVEDVQGRFAYPWPNMLYTPNVALATAIQAKARGWDALAERLLDLASRIGISDMGCIQSPGMPPSQMLAILARVHFANELVQPDSDRAAIAPRLEASLSFGGPTPCTECYGDVKANCTFGPLARALRTTLEHRRAAPGTVEAKVDALSDISTPIWHDYRQDPAFLRVAELGFDAVPTLLDHLTDQRLTRTVEHMFDGTRRLRLLDEIVRELLQGIVADRVEPAALRAWWARAQALGEEAYVLDHVLPAASGAQAPNGILLLVLAHKYPRRLEDAYTRALARPPMRTGDIAAAIARSALPAADRRRLLLEGAGNATLAHRFEALPLLQPLDPEAYATLLVRELDALPSTPRGPYWLAPERHASELASLTDAPAVWAALLRAARRADVGLRMELVNRLHHPGDRQRRERLVFLAAFLDDDAVPDVARDPEKWAGPRAGFHLGSVAVRDLAAMTIAWILGVGAEPARSWTRAEWNALGGEVKRALARAGLDAGTMP